MLKTQEAKEVIMFQSIKILMTESFMSLKRLS